MDTATLVLTAVSVAAAIVAAWIAWLAYRSAKRVEDLSTERSFVAWQVYPLSDGTFDICNVGHDAAHEVTVEAWTSEESVRNSAAVVPPLPAEGGSVHVVLPEREANGPDEPELPELARRPPGVQPPADILRMRERMREELIEQQVQVRVSWRSERGRWSNWEDQTG